LFTKRFEISPYHNWYLQKESRLASARRLSVFVLPEFTTILTSAEFE